MEMKFGPFVGDAKSMSKQELKKYRNDDPNYPLLFLSHGSILDVSNESKNHILPHNQRRKFYQN